MQTKILLKAAVGNMALKEAQGLLDKLKVSSSHNLVA